MAKTLGSTGENGTIALFARAFAAGNAIHPNVIAGPGDDCAILASADPGTVILHKTDAVIEGVHFYKGERPGQVGHKALARALSDIAAMGGTPTTALVTTVLPPEVTVSYARALAAGLARTARKYGVAIAGGETAAPHPDAPALIISIALLGTAPAHQCIRRSGGKPGDQIFVTGKLGGSLPSGRHLTFSPRLAEGRFLAARGATSMMDLSDGLAADLPRLTLASGCSATIDPEALPRHRSCTVHQAATDGEDYELLLTLPPKTATTIQKAFARKFPNLTLTPVGKLTRGTSTISGLPPGGWDHFAAPERKN